MPKDSRARTRAVRAVMDETGLPYTRAAHLLDSRTAGTGGEPGPAEGQLHVVPFVLSFTVPAAVDRRALAQGLADELHSLRRETTGEQYEGRADVIVPAQSWGPVPDLPGQVAALLLVHAWAVRPWDRGGEWEASSLTSTPPRARGCSTGTPYLPMGTPQPCRSAQCQRRPSPSAPNSPRTPRASTRCCPRAGTS